MFTKIKEWWANVPRRYKSAPAWLTLIGSVCLFIGNDTLKKLTGMDEATFNTTISTIFTVLVGFGIFNNPTDRDNF